MKLKQYRHEGCQSYIAYDPASRAGVVPAIIIDPQLPLMSDYREFIAAHGLKVHLGWVVASYDLGEALANLVQPFWMLPSLGLFGLRARDVMGYTLVVFLVLTPLVLVLVTLLGATLHYPL